MKITIINSERNEKRYTREELEAFVAQLSDGTYRQQYVRDFNKEVCFAAEWVKLNGELKAKSYNCLILLSLENLRDLSTVEEYKRLAILQPYTLLCFMGHDAALYPTLLYGARRSFAPHRMSIYGFGWPSVGDSLAQRLPQAALHLFVTVGYATG